MNKKAILLPETIRVIIALIAIGLLIYLLASLYGLFKTQTSLEQAKVVLEQISKKADLLKEGEEDSYLVSGPKYWDMFSFDAGEQSPSDCNAKNCLCICPSTIIRDSIKMCDNAGVCKIEDTKFRFIPSLISTQITLIPFYNIIITKQLNGVYLSIIGEPTPTGIKSEQKKYDIIMLSRFLEYDKGQSPKKIKDMLYDLALEQENTLEYSDNFHKIRDLIIQDAKFFFNEINYPCGLNFYIRLVSTKSTIKSQNSINLNIYDINSQKCENPNEQFLQIFTEVEPPKGEEFPLQIELMVGTQNQ